MPMPVRTVIIFILFVCFGLFSWSGTLNASAAQPSQRVDKDVKQARQALKTYLQFRKRGDEDKRYSTFSRRVREILSRTGVTDEKQFLELESTVDHAQLIDFAVIKVEKVEKEKVKATVRAKWLREHPDGGITSEEVDEFLLVREDDQWKLDERVSKDGTRYLP